jgi:arylsulfatase A-like enzyme
MVELMDQNVGRLLERVDKLGLAEKTVVVFTSDNGGWGPGTDSAPLRGQKGQLYEGGIRVPLIVRWPGKAAPGSRSAEPTINVDFYPTFCEMTGTKPPADQPLDGASLVPLLTGKRKALKREAIFWHFPAYTKRWPDNTTLAGPFITRPVGAMRQGDWKLLEFFEDNHLELYNLREDPGESKNLAATMPDKAKALHDRMKRWRKELNAPVPTKPNPKYSPAG